MSQEPKENEKQEVCVISDAHVAISLDALDEIESILNCDDLSDHDRLHLIKSQFILANMRKKQADKEEAPKENPNPMLTLPLTHPRDPKTPPVSPACDAPNPFEHYERALPKADKKQEIDAAFDLLHQAGQALNGPNPDLFETMEKARLFFDRMAELTNNGTNDMQIAGFGACYPSDLPEDVKRALDQLVKEANDRLKNGGNPK